MEEATGGDGSDATELQYAGNWQPKMTTAVRKICNNPMNIAPVNTCSGLYATGRMWSHGPNGVCSSRSPNEFFHYRSSAPTAAETPRAICHSVTWDITWRQSRQATFHCASPVRPAMRASLGATTYIHATPVAMQRDGHYISLTEFRILLVL